MARENSGYIDVDKLAEQIDVERVLQFYGAGDVELFRSGSEVRMRCVLNCDRDCETGNRAIAMRTDGVKRWKCHQYECGRAGNLIGFIDLLKDGASMNGRPRGQRFKEIAKDVQSMANGDLSPPMATLAAARQPEPLPTDERKINVPLVRHEKETARALVSLDEQFLVEPGEAMNKHAAAYIRSRPYMTPDLLRKWRCGYLPHDAKGLLRGKFVYPLLNERGEVVTWFGRDCEYEQKRTRWESGGRDPKREPRKHQFVKGFHRGLELFGQHAGRLDEPGYRDAIAELGVLVVEGPNGVLRLDALGIPAVAACSNQVTEAQAAKLARWANELSDGTVTLMFDNDSGGEDGTKQALHTLARHTRVRLGWSSSMFDGAYRGRQPESLTEDEWQRIRVTLSQP